MKRILSATAALLLVMYCPAALAQMSGPVLGYVVDSGASAIRVVKGIPGASAVGELAGVNLRISKAVVSAEFDYALAVSAEDGSLVVIANLSGDASVTGVRSVPAGADLLALSTDGSAAASYNPQTSRIQVIRGLPANPVVRSEIDTSLWAPQRVTALAINRDGIVLAAFSNGEIGTIYSFDGGVIRFIDRAREISAISFAGSGTAAVVADRVLNQVVLFQNLRSVVAGVAIAGAGDGISDPIGVVVTGDGKTAYVANSTSGAVTVVPLAGGSARNISCNCALNTVQALKGDAVFAVTAETGRGILVFNGAADEPRFVAVPPAQP